MLCCGCRTERVTSSMKDLTDYFSRRTGPLAIPGGCEALAFLALDGNAAGWPDLELLFVSGSITSDVTFQDGFGLDKQLYREVSARSQCDGHPKVVHVGSNRRVSDKFPIFSVTFHKKISMGIPGFFFYKILFLKI